MQRGRTTVREHVGVNAKKTWSQHAGILAPQKKAACDGCALQNSERKTRTQHAGILRMFVANDSVQLARQTKGIESDEDVDQCRFLVEMKVWIRPGGLRFAG